MSSIVISGDTSGAVTVSAPAIAGTNTLTLQAATATNAVNTLATAVASTSGTSIDFTSLPSWIKKITVMFSGVSTSGANNILIQLGAGSVDSASYNSASARTGASAVSTTGYTNGFGVNSTNAANVIGGSVFITNLTSNTWVAQGIFADQSQTNTYTVGGNKALSGTLDRIRITTSGGTDTFDAGTINILYEG